MKLYGKAYGAWVFKATPHCGTKTGKNVPEAPRNQEVCSSKHPPLSALILCFIFLQNVYMYL